MIWASYHSYMQCILRWGSIESAYPRQFFFIELLLPSHQKSQLSCICVLGVSIFPLSKVVLYWILKMFRQRGFFLGGVFILFSLSIRNILSRWICNCLVALSPGLNLYSEGKKNSIYKETHIIAILDLICCLNMCNILIVFSNCWSFVLFYIIFVP